MLKRWIGFMLAVMLSGTVAASEVAGVIVPEQVVVAGRVLDLNGAGIRKKFFIKVYVAGLYLPEKTDSAEQAIVMPGPKRVFMQFVYTEVSAEKMAAAWEEGFINNETAEALANMSDRLDRFKGITGTMREGDQIIFDFTPGMGVEVKVNGVVKGVIEGDDFTRALLRVWLGDEPADKGLKSSLLGQ